MRHRPNERADGDRTQRLASSGCAMRTSDSRPTDEVSERSEECACDLHGVTAVVVAVAIVVTAVHC